MTLIWFQPMAIDGTRRRPFFERVPECNPETRGWFGCNDLGSDDERGQVFSQDSGAHAELCRAAVDRWCRNRFDKIKYSRGNKRELRANHRLMVLLCESDQCACYWAHRLADALGIKR